MTARKQTGPWQVNPGAVFTSLSEWAAAAYLYLLQYIRPRLWPRTSGGGNGPR